MEFDSIIYISALMRAVQSNNIEIVSLLLSQPEIDINIKTI